MLRALPGRVLLVVGGRRATVRRQGDRAFAEQTGGGGRRKTLSVDWLLYQTASRNDPAEVQLVDESGKSLGRMPMIRARRVAWDRELKLEVIDAAAVPPRYHLTSSRNKWQRRKGDVEHTAQLSKGYGPLVVVIRNVKISGGDLQRKTEEVITKLKMGRIVQLESPRALKPEFLKRMKSIYDHMVEATRDHAEKVEPFSDTSACLSYKFFPKSAAAGQSETEAPS